MDSGEETYEAYEADGLLDRVNRERPSSLAVIGLEEAAQQVLGISVDPGDLARNVPQQNRQCLADVRRAHEWVSEFLRALDEVEEDALESPGAAPLPFE